MCVCVIQSSLYFSSLTSEPPMESRNSYFVLALLFNDYVAGNNEHRHCMNDAVADIHDFDRRHSIGGVDPKGAY